MKSQTSAATRRRLLIAGVAAILLGTFGIATVTAWVPGAPAQIPPAPAERDARPNTKCAECGVVESTRQVEQFDAGVDRGTAGRAAGLGLKATPASQGASYQVTVRMMDRSRRVFMDANPANWRPGERVIFIDGAGRSND